MGGIISTIVGAVVGGALVVGGVATYQAATTSDTQQTNPNAVGYADE
jgi:hypothetical protein